jgi:cytoskeletal protein CcmA (bactofilin family)
MFKSKFNLSNMETTIASTTIIAAGTTINGDIKSEGDIRIDGTLNVNLTANAKIFIGAEGMVKGNITAVHADIFGKVKGNLKIKELLQLLGKCDVEGDIFASKLQIEPTARFNGSCHTGASVVGLNKELGNVVNK